MDSNKFLCMINLKNHNYITLIKCIGSVGETILPMLLIFEVNILYKWYQHNKWNNNIVISITKTGYAKNNIVLKQLQYFINYIQNKR